MDNQYTYEQLKQETIHALRARLRSVGAGCSKKETKDDLIRRFIEITMTVQPSDAEDTEVVKQKEKIIPMNAERLLEILEPFRRRGLKVSISPDATCWGMANGKRVDSGTMSMPEKTVLRCAEMVMINAA